MMENIIDYVEKHKIFENKKKILLGVSGGADSVYLFYQCIELSKIYGFEIFVAHVNHKLRGEEANRDEQYVRRLCLDYDVPCFVASRDIGADAKSQKISVEECGRNARKQIFEELMVEHNMDAIATAHHMDDNVETFLINLIRGSGNQGLTGIKPVQGPYIRPILSLRKKEIEEYLNRQAIEYCVDHTNLENVYTRNKIRNQVIPLFEEINPKGVEHINDTMGDLIEVETFLEQEVEKAFELCVVKENGGLELVEKHWGKIPQLLKKKVVKKSLELVSGEHKNIGRIHIEAIIRLGELQVGRKIDLPYNVEAWKTYRGIFLRKQIETKKRKIINQEIILERTLDLDQEIKVRTKIVSKDKVDNQGQKLYTKYFDYDIIKDVLTMRNREDGDYFQFNKKGNTQSLKKYFVNEKISSFQRDDILLLAEGNEILWIVGYRMSPKYAVTDQTKTILEIEIINGGKKNGDN